MVRNLKFAFLLLLTSSAIGQTLHHSFVLNGTINADSGKITLASISDSGYYSYKTNIETKVINGSFRIEGDIHYPTAYILILHESSEIKYLSNIFYIEKGSQSIKCNVDSLRETPFISNGIMSEYKSFSKRFSATRRKMYLQSSIRDSLSKIYGRNIPDELSIKLANKDDSLDDENNLILFNYSKENPTSYIPLWTLVRWLPSGYKPMYDSIFSQFSNLVKQSTTGKLLEKKLRAARSLMIGKSFPDLSLRDTSGKSVRLTNISRKRYTLVDFWFSHCAPCKKQFPKLKNLFERFNVHGFQIVGISVDQEKDIADWKKVIKEQNLTWAQYRDDVRKNVDRLSIQYYPTNFLIDDHGIIIKRDISLVDLEKFLQAELAN